MRLTPIWVSTFLHSIWGTEIPENMPYVPPTPYILSLFVVSLNNEITELEIQCALSLGSVVNSLSTIQEFPTSISGTGLGLFSSEELFYSMYRNRKK